MKILKSMKLEIVIIYLVIVICILGFICMAGSYEDPNSKAEMANIKAKHEEFEREQMVAEYKRNLDEKIVDFQFDNRKPQDKHLFTLYDSKTNPNAVKYDHWIEYDLNTDSLVLNDYLEMDGSVTDIENEIRGEYSLAKSIPISDTKSAPSHVTIKLYLAEFHDNSDIIKTLAEYKDGSFTTNILRDQGEKYKGQSVYYKNKDLPKSK